MIGKTLAHYEVTEKIGEGGMGVVYRARDTRLGRDVALKVLPEQFARDPQRMGRFEREARVLASLNHPNIASIYGLEQQNGVHALVMELVEGPTLADRIDEGAIPVDEALPLARQIADALEYAHEHGVVHRDLKPANVKVTEDGTVKVLDFGLAKAITDEESISDPENSPTLTIGATKAGVILGTAAYMAPEQARGRRVDKRADIWAFGVVLYEMVTGNRLFRGEDMTDTLASVVKEQPDLGAAPAKVRRLVSRCLEKDPKKRLRDIGDVWELLEEPPLSDARGSQVSRLGRMGWVAAAVLAVALLAALLLGRRDSAPQLQSVEFQMEPPLNNWFTFENCGFAASPDGRSFVFAATGRGAASSSLWLRPLDSTVARRLDGSEGGNCPTWSPDGRQLVFFAGGEMKRIDISGGGTPVTLARVAEPPVSPAGAWNRDDVILVGSREGLQQVSATGGGATLLTTVDPSQEETGHGFPEFLPDGNRFLYFVASNDPNVQGVYLSSLDEPGRRTLVVLTAAKAVYVPPRAAYPGYLLWMQNRTLVARAFDPDSVAFDGDTEILAQNITLNPDTPIRASFWASDAGLLVYFVGDQMDRRPVIRMSRNGVEREQIAPADVYFRLALAPDNGRIAVSRSEDTGQPGRDIWVWELASGGARQITSGSSTEDYPVWSPDGTELAFSSDQDGGVLQIHRKAASGVGAAVRLTEGPNNKVVSDWSHGFLFYMENNPETGWDAMALPLEGDRTPIPVVRTQHDEQHPAVSPDGRWVAYTTDDSGRREVCIQEFAAEGAPEGICPVSNGGGRNPRWRGDGRELYYQNGDGDLMAVTIEASPQGIRPQSPRELLTGLRLRTGLVTTRQFDFTPDGDDFVLLLPGEETQETRRLTVITNWQARLGQ